MGMDGFRRTGIIQRATDANAHIYLYVRVTLRHLCALITDALTQTRRFAALCGTRHCVQMHAAMLYIHTVNLKPDTSNRRAEREIYSQTVKC